DHAGTGARPQGKGRVGTLAKTVRGLFETESGGGRRLCRAGAGRRFNRRIAQCKSEVPGVGLSISQHRGGTKSERSLSPRAIGQVRSSAPRPRRLAEGDRAYSLDSEVGTQRQTASAQAGGVRN